MRCCVGVCRMRPEFASYDNYIILASCFGIAKNVMPSARMG